MLHRVTWTLGAIGLACVLAATPALVAQGICNPPMDGDIARQNYEPDAIYWEPLVEYDRLILRVDAPCDTIERIFERGENPVFELRQVLGPLDGSYRWELRVEPVVDPEVREALKKAHETGDDSIVRKLQGEGLLPKGPFVEGEAFSVVEGRIVPPGDGEEESRLASRSMIGRSADLSVSGAVSGAGDAAHNGDNRLLPKDVFHYDDVIITGSVCVGFDCVNGESFGYDTIKLKENNLRIGFDDTSTGSFPTNNWQLRANDSTSGGKSYFGIVDMGSSGTSTGGDLVFAIEAGTPASSLYVDDYGRVGLGTSIPYVELHIADGDTPTVRLDQDGSSGFAPHVWDVAGNETNFFIRDVTDGSKLVFRIFPGADSSSLVIDSDSNVGIGTASPDAKLHIVESGAVRYRLENISAGTQWDANNDGNGDFAISLVGTGGNELEIEQDGDIGNCGNPDHDFVLSSGASCSATPRSWIDAGSTSFSTSSSRAYKKNLEAVAVPDILERIRQIPVYRYDFVGGPADRIGLVAEDFHQVFERGSDAELNGQEVQLAMWLAIQQLIEQNRELREEVDQLKASAGQ